MTSQREEIARFVVAQFGLDVGPAELSPDYDLLEAGVLDSIGAYTVAAWLVRRYDLDPRNQEVLPEQVSSIRASRRAGE
ncbi:hypothetical protein C8D87_115120 [Lentzea atacamensis]|uniref:Acyl carrier protein n=1 Tax=Lentzea atacamensis TaxID=531938 RepID=A0ABX9DVR4_9PSEU|nr:acyl carrier protein [Lentzea atacamensis]RAS59260.1 hypothetical protein C8D87_115120 [Lentzea atacamensis]